MNVTFFTIKCCVFVSLSLFYLVDASENAPTARVETAATPVAAATVPPVQQQAAPSGAPGAPPAVQQQPGAQVTTDVTNKKAVVAPSSAIQQQAQSAVAQPVVAARPLITLPVLSAQPVVQAPVIQQQPPQVAAQPAVATPPPATPIAAPQQLQAVPEVVQEAASLPTDSQPEQSPMQSSVETQAEVSQPSQIDAPSSNVNEAQKSAEPPIPAAPAEAAEQTAEVAQAPVVKKPEAIPAGEGIDTLEQEGGNWLLKRQALEKTIDVIEKIKDVFTKTLETRVDYLVKRNKIDRSFDTFANAIGFELGDLNQLLASLLKQLKAERVQEGDLSEEERAVLKAVEDKIKELKALKSTIKSITEMDASLDEVLMQLEKEITASNSYQTRAWKNFQTIKKVLSDEKAEELYLQTESLLKNMQEILKYLNGDLLQYFNGVIDTLKRNMSDTQEKIKTLETKGVNLQDEVKKIKKAEKLARKNKKQKSEDVQKKEQEKTAEVKVPQKEVKKEGWFDYIAVVWRYPLALVSSLWDYGISFFVTKKVTAKTSVEVMKVAEKRKVELATQSIDAKKKAVIKEESSEKNNAGVEKKK